MTDQHIQDIAEAELLKNLRLWYVNSVTLLNNLAGLPLSNSSAQAMSNLISGFHDLQPDYKTIEERFQEEREAVADLLRHPRREM